MAAILPGFIANNYPSTGIILRRFSPTVLGCSSGEMRTKEVCGFVLASLVRVLL